MLYKYNKSDNDIIGYGILGTLGVDIVHIIRNTISFIRADYTMTTVNLAYIYEGHSSELVILQTICEVYCPHSYTDV